MSDRTPAVAAFKKQYGSLKDCLVNVDSEDRAEFEDRYHRSMGYFIQGFEAGRESLASAAAQNVVAREALERICPKPRIGVRLHVQSTSPGHETISSICSDALAKMDALASAGALVGGGE